MALVTGAESGLDLRFTKALVNAGVKVAVAGRRVELLSAVVEDIDRTEQAPGIEVHVTAIDL